MNRSWPGLKLSRIQQFALSAFRTRRDKSLHKHDSISIAARSIRCVPPTAPVFGGAEVTSFASTDAPTPAAGPCLPTGKTTRAQCPGDDKTPPPTDHWPAAPGRLHAIFAIPTFPVRSCPASLPNIDTPGKVGFMQRTRKAIPLSLAAGGTV